MCDKGIVSVCIISVCVQQFKPLVFKQFKNHISESSRSANYLKHTIKTARIVNNSKSKTFSDVQHIFATKTLYKQHTSASVKALSPAKATFSSKA